MQKQGEGAGNGDAHPTPAGFNDIDIREQTSNPDPNEHYISIRFNLPKEIVNTISSSSNNRKERMRQLQARESTPEWLAIRENAEKYRRLQDKQKDEKRRNGHQLYKAYCEMDSYIYHKQKYGYSMFEPFQQRGKHPHIKFTHLKTKNNSAIQPLEIRFNKRYLLEELKLPRSNLIQVPASFISIWETDFCGMVKIINTLSNQNDRNSYYTLFIKSIDLISITFDVQYNDKRSYRIRYSPFEFRTSVFLKEQFQLVGYNQCLSVIPDTSIKTAISDQDFYQTPRCFIFDDLTDNNMFAKIVMRTNIFHNAYSISRGMHNPNPTGLEADQFSKKCLWWFYFSTTRLKKFMFTWSFKPFKRVTARFDKIIKDIELQSKEMILHVPFYLQIKETKQLGKDDYPYRIRVQYQDFNRNIPIHVKDQIISRTKEWYTNYKDVINFKDTNREKHQLELDRIMMIIKKQKRQREADPEKNKDKPEREETQLEMYFGSRDRFDRFLLGFLVIVSTVIDRNYFTMTDANCIKTGDKIAVLDTPESFFVNKKHQHMNHFHWLEIYLQNKLLPQMVHPRQERNLYKYNDLKIKCGQWRFYKLLKCKREWNLKLKKPSMESSGFQVLSLPQIFRDYIDILLKHFPLRYIYKDIINFIAGIGKNCYVGWEQSNNFDLIPKNQSIFRPIVSAILSYYYFTPLAQNKEKDDKIRQKMAQQKHLSEQQRLRRDEKLVEQFSRVVVLKILNRGDVGFMAEDKLMAQVTFRIMEYKGCWITRMNEGFIILRVFEDRIDFERQYERMDVLKFGLKNKNIALEQQQVRQKLQKLSSEVKSPIIL